MNNKFEQKFYGWTYRYDNGKYEVIPDKKILQPKTFFKYYALSEYSVDALTHTYIYASHPNQLNDLFDCSNFLFNFDHPACVRHILGDLPGYQNSSNEELLLPYNKYLAQQGFKMSVYQKQGLFSLTTTSDNLLMWAHYANNTGFCVEYDISKFDFKYHGPFPINYQDKIQSIPISKMRDLHLAMLVQCDVKQSIWDYENEWRLLIESPESVSLSSHGDPVFEELEGAERKFLLSIDAIKKIRLGMSFFDFTERKNSLYEIANTHKCIFKLNNTKTTLLKKSLLDFVSDYQVPIEYTIVTSIDTVECIPMFISKSYNSNTEYVGQVQYEN